MSFTQKRSKLTMNKREVLFVFIENKWNNKGPIQQQMKKAKIHLKLNLNLKWDQIHSSQVIGLHSCGNVFFIFHCSKTKQVPCNLLTERLESATPNFMLSFTSQETESSWSEEQRDNFPRRKRVNNNHCARAMFLNFVRTLSALLLLMWTIVFENLAIDQSSQLNKI